MFTCYSKLGEFMPASKHASTSVLALIIYIEFLVLFYTTFPKDFGEAKQNCPKNACISLLNYSTWRKHGTSPNHLLCFSDVMFTCQGLANSCQLQSSLVPSFLLSSKGFNAIKSPVIFYTNFHENSGEITLNELRWLVSIVLTERRSGASDHQKKPRKAPGALTPLPKKCLRLTVELFNLAKARDFPESASVFQWCNVYVPGQVRRIHDSFKAR